jgi:hypothetical protein
VRIGKKIGKTFVSYGKSGVYVSRWIGGIRVSHFERTKKKRAPKEHVPNSWRKEKPEKIRYVPNRAPRKKKENPVEQPKPLSKRAVFYVTFFIVSIVWLIVI